ncbi:MAG TPA: hypothetical protein VFG52_04935, partial [Xanthomonadales bacterium]|nr:hypothetical protein [Xanthomonadales bacterium]
FQQRDLAAIKTLKKARTVLADKSIIDEVDISLFLAELYAGLDNQDEMRLELNRALEGTHQAVYNSMHQASFFVAWRLAPDLLPEKPDQLNADADALWRAFDHLRSGNREAAGKSLAEAQVFGVDHSRLADEARWLQYQLGQAVSAEIVLDPPYPPLSRVVLRRNIRNGLGLGSADM